jgi:release factor glutamine methyltransferase
VTEEEAILRLRAAGCVFAEDEAAVLAEAAGRTTPEGRAEAAAKTPTAGRTEAAAKTPTAGKTATGAKAGGRITAGPGPAQRDDLAALVDRRCAGEPLEQVVGHADFAGVRVRLRPGVFVPRVRSELLVQTAAEEAGRHPDPLVVDLCCGSGALGLAVRHRVAVTLHAADLDPVAVACARDNLGGNVHQGDLFDALPPELEGRITVLLANVPYVATRHIPFLPAEARDHEPHMALDGGQDGLDIFRSVLKKTKSWLAPGGLLLSEITDAQIEAAVAAVDGNGLTAAVITDDDLDARVITARR